MPETLHLTDAVKGYTYDQDKLLTPEETIRRVRDRLGALDLKLPSHPPARGWGRKTEGGQGHLRKAPGPLPQIRGSFHPALHKSGDKVIIP